MNSFFRRCMVLLLSLCLLLGSAGPAQADSNIEFMGVWITQKQLNFFLNAIKTALNTTTLKKYAPDAVANMDSFLEAVIDEASSVESSETAIKKAAVRLIKSGEYEKDGRTGSYVIVTKAAGSKYNVMLAKIDTSVVKEDIPKAAVAPPDLSELHFHIDPDDDIDTEFGGTATCVELAICQFPVCGEPYGKIDPENHEWGAWQVVEPRDGQLLWRRVCTRCGGSEERLLPHIHTGGTATCTEPAVCTICGLPYGDPPGHDWSEWEVTVAASCTEKGEEIRVCKSNPEHQETREIEALGHQAVTVPGVAASCTESGLTEGAVCAVCGEILIAQEEIPALDHDWGEWRDAEAQEGYRMLQRRVCAREDEHVEWRTVDRPVPAQGASPVIPPHTHSGGQASCTEPAVCAACGVAYIRPLGHTKQTVPAKEPTCTEPGLTEGVVCAVCGEILKAQEELPALGHTEEILPATVTCTEDGLTEGVRCAVCKEILKAQEEVPALGHIEETVPGKRATCIEPGLTDGTICSVCGEILKAQEEIPHAHTAVTVSGKAAACTSSGWSDWSYCGECGTILQESKRIPMLWHDWGDMAVYDSTCFKHTCKRCGTVAYRMRPVHLSREERNSVKAKVSEWKAETSSGEGSSAENPSADSSSAEAP